MLTEAKKAKLNQFKSVFIEYPLVTTIINDFNKLRLYHDIAGEKPCMMLSGDTGCGKSALIKHYYESNPPYLSEGRRKVPVLLSRIPSNPSIESTLKQLLHDLGQFGAKSKKQLRHGNDLALAENLVEQLKLSGTEIIIIDEFQELVENNLGKKRRDIANQFKYLNDKAGISIVLVGMPWIEQIADEPQWSSRIFIRRFIPYFKLSEDSKLFIRLLMGLANRMPFTEKPNLAKEEIVLALFAISNGCFRKLKNFVDWAFEGALISNSINFNKQHLISAFSELRPDLPNVFEMEVQKIKGCEVEQYSQYKPEGPQDDEPFIETKFGKKVPLVQLLKK
jgi:type II secretory pathway predicted ATPase ExeA